MKKCLKCNVSYSDDKKFCKSCGQELSSSNTKDPKISIESSVFEEKLKADPLNVKLLLDYAQLHLKNSQYKESINLLLKVLVIDKNNVVAPGLLFKSYIRNKDYIEALEVGEKLLRSLPKNLNLLSDLVEIAQKADLDGKASDFLERIIAIKPNDKDALVKMATILSKNGSDKDVFEAWKKVYEIDSSNPIACFQLAKSFCDNVQYSQSIELIEKVIDQLNTSDKNLAKLYYCYSLIKTNEDDSRLPNLINNLDIEEFSNSLNPRINDLLHEIYIYQGKISLDRNKFEDALNYLNKAQEISQDTIIKELLAETYYKSSIKELKFDELENATIQIENALELMPENEDYKNQLENIQQSQKKAKRKKTTLFLIIIAAFIGIIISVAVYKNLEEKHDWNQCKQLNTFNSFQKYIDVYGNGKFIKEAVLLQEDALWREALEYNSVEMIDKYLAMYKYGKYANMARIKRADFFWLRSCQFNTVAAYDDYLSNCSGINNEYESIAHTRIDSIYDISPDVERIKNDLIGQVIIGWHFDNLEEFLEAKILNELKGGGKTVLTTKFKLIDNNNQSEHDCEVLVEYTKSGQGWYLSGVKANYFTFKYTVSTDAWLSVSPLSNCSYEIIDSGQKYWAKEDTYNATNYKGGPGGEVFHFSSSTIYLMSREDHPIDLILKYKPSE